MAVMAMVKTCQCPNTNYLPNMATLGLRKNSMEMTTKFTLPMGPMEQMGIQLVNLSMQVMATTSLTWAMTGKQPTV